jgi:hypothetical protein
MAGAIPCIAPAIDHPPAWCASLRDPGQKRPSPGAPLVRPVYGCLDLVALGDDVPTLIGCLTCRPPCQRNGVGRAAPERSVLPPQAWDLRNVVTEPIIEAPVQDSQASPGAHASPDLDAFHGRPLP